MSLNNMAQYIEVITKVVPLMVYKYAPTIREVALMTRLINAPVAIKKFATANNALIEIYWDLCPNFMSQLQR